jgi:hypothetical protein
MPVVTDQERVRRVTEEGSRRKRDLAALRRVEVAQAEHRLAALTPEQNDAMRETWSRVVLQLWHAVPDTTFAIWFAPLRFLGAEDSTLYLTAPEGIRTWVERRYSNLIREALQATGSAYTEVEFVDVGEGTS